jgi:outer membrane protein OmpA-like peptidoglycan-associated protein
MRPIPLAAMPLAVLLLALAAATLAPPASAQAPTPQSLIEQLRPHEGQDTRGVLRLPPSPGAPSTSGVAPAVARPQATLQVNFGFDSAELTPQAIAVLDSLGQALTSRTLTLYRFRLVGHTDAKGSEAYNLALSQRRADAVARYLRERWDVDATRLVPEGRGFRELADPAHPLSPANRRVVVINEGPAG